MQVHIFKRLTNMEFSNFTVATFNLALLLQMKYHHLTK
jgi:hypothetical protein